LRKKTKLSDSTSTPPTIDEQQDPNDLPIYKEFQPKDPNIIEGKRKRKPTQKARAAAGDDNEWITINEEANLKEAMSITIGSEPCTVPEAQRAPDWLQWKEAMDYEINALQSCNTWSIVDDPNDQPPPGIIEYVDKSKPKLTNIVSSKWAFRYKRDENGQVVKYCAHLVAQGFTQVDGIDYYADETFASICKLSSVCSILTIAAREDWEIEQLDVKSTYLYGKLAPNEIIYMKPPPHYKLEGYRQGQVLQLNSTIYGLKQYGRRWYEVLRCILDNFKLVRLETDHAVF
jgi:hypothetical protein